MKTIKDDKIQIRINTELKEHYERVLAENNSTMSIHLNKVILDYVLSGGKKNQ